MSQTNGDTAAQDAVHSTFSIERIYPASASRVFFAHSDEATKRRWFAEGEGWTIDEYRLDFRVDGVEFSRFRYQDGPEITLHSVIQDIVPDRRIVIAYRMTLAGKPLSASLGTIELTPTDGGTLLRYTEQGAFLDGPDSAKGREEGSRWLLEALARELEAST
ncbi:SRPBCC family protein [Arvimicrobium flavum]|uniref:SRPBCC family protein n=1 Tax=Arvimicrobium flavum TaxID=3393320 RepID=UPI00237A822D|nr:SRPBCC family protein [Mesorhizobium shangrilense]